MRLSVRNHRVVDFILIVLLLVAPRLFGFEAISAARNTFWILAAAALLLSLVRSIPLGLHRAFEAVLGYWVMISPSLFDYRAQLSGLQYLIHFIIGLLWIGAAIFTRATAPSGPELRPVRSAVFSWVVAALAVNIAISLGVILSPGWKAQAPGGAGIAPDNRVAQDLNPTPLKGFVGKSEIGVDASQADRIFELRADPSIPAFHPDRLQAQAGTTICVHFTNPSTVDHYDNFVLVRPGTEQHVGTEAMSVGPEGGYIPILPDEIIAHTETVAPGGTASTCFHVPKKPGAYPFISSARNRWTTMKGILVVTR